MNNDEFPLLDVHELVICLQECDFTAATEEIINKPTSDNIIKLYEQIIDLFADISIEKYLNDNYNNNNNNNNNNDTNDEDDDLGTVSVVILNLICNKFFQKIGINDFNMMDLYRPEFQRTKRILSAVVNYARFREERIFDCKNLITEMSNLSDIFESKFDAFNLLKQQKFEIENEIGENLNSKDEENQTNLITLENKSESLESELKELTKKQENLSLDYDTYKLQKHDLLKDLEKLSMSLIELESKRDKLNKLAQTNISELDNNIENLNNTLVDKQKSIDELQLKQNNLENNLLILERIIREVNDLLKIVSSDIQDSCEREAIMFENKQKLISTRERLNNILSTSIISKTSGIEEQLQKQNQNLEKLKSDMNSRIHQNDEKINDLEKIYKETIVPKINDTDKYIQDELINNQAKTTELKIQNLREKYNNEFDEIEQEYSLLVDHIRKYMTTILGNID